MRSSFECQASDGHRWEVPVARADAPVAGLLWLPALGVPASKYRGFSEALANVGISSGIHEWRGLGSSSLRPSRKVDWGYRELVDHDIPASLARVRDGSPGLPWLIGGHSIGGQLAVLALARHPALAKGIVLAATGVPDARAYATRHRLLVGGFARLIPLVSGAVGHFPGDRLKWAGREAAQLMRQWAGTVRTGHYREVGLGPDIEERMADINVPRLGLRMSDDWLVPKASLDLLLAKLGPGPLHHEEFDADRLGVPADHFRWMRKPEGVAQAIADWAHRALLAVPSAKA